VSERERQQHNEPNREAIRDFANTFLSRMDMYPLQLADGQYVTVRKPLNLNRVESHFRGKLTLGTYALDARSQGRWICLDADDDQGWHEVIGLAHSLANRGIAAYLEQSRRGGHMWLFLSPLPGKLARQFGMQLLAEHAIAGIELYPKQDVLKTGPGSLVRLPLGIHRKSGHRYHFVHPDGSPIAPTIRQQIALLADPIRVPQAFIEQVLTDIPTALSPPSTAFPKVDRQPGKHLSERIKGSISVRDFVSRYVVLDEGGRGFCPFHDDTHKSFGVNDEGNYWHCWAGCGGGSVIDFWMKWRESHGQDASFVATITDLAQMLF
jgi:hypothetical protein